MASEADAADSRVPSQDDYEKEVHETRWVPLQDGPGEFKVVEVPPLRLLREMEAYGVMEIMSGDDDADFSEVLDEGDLNGFIDDVVAPNIVEPDAYWSDGDAPDGDFDLAALSAADLMAIITGLTGRDADELEDQMDDRFR